MTPEQQQLQQAIANIDKIVGAFTCDRPVRYVVDEAWALIIREARKACPAEKKDAPPPEKT